VAQIRPLADKIFYSSKATMHINSHTNFTLDFQNFNFSTARTVKRVVLHQCAKFHRNRSNRGRDNVSFNIMLVWLENAYSRHFGFGGAHFPQMMPRIVLTPKKDRPWAEPRHLSHKPRILSYILIFEWALQEASRLFPIGLTLRGPQK